MKMLVILYGLAFAAHAVLLWRGARRRAERRKHWEEHVRRPSSAGA